MSKILCLRSFALHSGLYSALLRDVSVYINYKNPYIINKLKCSLLDLNAILHYKRTFPGKVLVVSWPRRHRVRSSALGKISKWRISTNFSVNSRIPSWVIKEAFWAHPTWVYTCIIFYLRYLLKICLFFLIYRISE